ncbi:MAG: class I SAM-dependent methyltransferase [Chloroflexi bacterium]|nr:class I SAM-dependent methyltransferase [Chloroflexota bacterium]
MPYPAFSPRDEAVPGPWALLDDLYRAAAEHDAREPDHSRKLLSLEPATARLLSLLVRSSRRRRVLEIGTSTAYSTIWLAWSVQRHGGRVVSIDRSRAKLELARTNLQRAGLLQAVELLEGDATSIVRNLPGPFDLVFFDADRVSAPAQLEALLPKLEPDVLLAADNVLSHPAEMADYLAAVQGLTDFQHVVVPIGKGLSLAYREARLGAHDQQRGPTVGAPCGRRPRSGAG